MKRIFLNLIRWQKDFQRDFSRQIWDKETFKGIFKKIIFDEGIFKGKIKEKKITKGLSIFLVHIVFQLDFQMNFFIQNKN